MTSGSFSDRPGAKPANGSDGADSSVSTPQTPPRATVPVAPWEAAAAAPQTTIPCPKCGAAVREIARFCPRCHMTMRYECPSCGNKQRVGVKCEKCGINFVKYIGAVVAAKKPAADSIEEKIDQRSALLKNIFAIPLTGGLSLFKRLVNSSKRNS